MGSSSDVSEDNCFKITTGYPVEIEEHVIAMVAKVLKNRQGPCCVRPAVANEHVPFDAAPVCRPLGPQAFQSRSRCSGLIPLRLRNQFSSAMGIEVFIFYLRQGR